MFRLYDTDGNGVLDTNVSYYYVRQAFWSSSDSG